MNNQGNLTYLQSFSNHAYRPDSLKLGAEIKKKVRESPFLQCICASAFALCEDFWFPSLPQCLATWLPVSLKLARLYRWSCTVSSVRRTTLIFLKITQSQLSLSLRHRRYQSAFEQESLAISLLFSYPFPVSYNQTVKQVYAKKPSDIQHHQRLFLSANRASKHLFKPHTWLDFLIVFYFIPHFTQQVFDTWLQIISLSLLGDNLCVCQDGRLTSLRGDVPLPAVSSVRGCLQLHLWAGRAWLDAV